MMNMAQLVIFQFYGDTDLSWDYMFIHCNALSATLMALWGCRQDGYGVDVEQQNSQRNRYAIFLMASRFLTSVHPTYTVESQLIC